MTPEQIARKAIRAMEERRTLYPDLDGWPRLNERDLETVSRALLAEHERAEANAADARRWRAVRRRIYPLGNDGAWWIEAYSPSVQGRNGGPCPIGIDAAADALADQQEAPNVEA